MQTVKALAKIAGTVLALWLAVYAFYYQATLPVDGVVVDAKTGKPVSKVLVMAVWHFSRANFVDSAGALQAFGTVTDDNGRFRIPKRNVTIFLGSFNDLRVRLKHPLYDFQETQVYSDLKHRYTIGTEEGGELRAVIPFTSLADRYSRLEDMDELSWVIDDCGPEFYVAMRDTYKTRYDLDEIMLHLESLTTRFPEIAPDANFAHQAFLRHQFQLKELMTKY